MGQIYLRNDEDSLWASSPDLSASLEAAVLLHKYGTNKSSRSTLDVVKFRNRKISPARNEREQIERDFDDNYYDQEGLFMTHGAFGFPRAIFVRPEYGQPYQWVDVEFEYDKGPDGIEGTADDESFLKDNNYKIDENGNPILKSPPALRPISEFLARKKHQVEVVDQLGNFDWPSFEARLEEMNSERSGDVIFVTDGREGYLAIDNPVDSYRGWHGGASPSESFVPLVLAMPGKAFVDESGVTNLPAQFKNPVSATVAQLRDDDSYNSSVSSGYIRNWHLGTLLTETLRNLYSEFPETN